MGEGIQKEYKLNFSRNEDTSFFPPPAPASGGQPAAEVSSSRSVFPAGGDARGGTNTPKK